MFTKLDPNSHPGQLP